VEEGAVAVGGLTAGGCDTARAGWGLGSELCIAAQFHVSSRTTITFVFSPPINFEAIAAAQQALAATIAKLAKDHSIYIALYSFRFYPRLPVPFGPRSPVYLIGNDCEASVRKAWSLR
jgi:hypothetical protein